MGTTSETFEKPCGIYTVYDHDGEIAYIGISTEPIYRLYQHGFGSPKYDLNFDGVRRIEIEWHKNRREAEAAELFLIEKHKPHENKRFKKPTRDRLMESAEYFAKLSDEAYDMANAV